MESAKLRTADKNMDSAGNSLPSYRILNAFSDGHLASILDDCGVAISGPQSDIIPLIRAREEAQAALAAAAVRCADSNSLAIVPVEAGGDAGPMRRQKLGMLLLFLLPAGFWLEREWRKQLPLGKFACIIGLFRCVTCFGTSVVGAMAGVAPNLRNTWPRSRLTW